MTHKSLTRTRARTLILTFVGGLFLAGCGGQENVETLKNNILDMCPGITVETLVEGYMEQVKWEAAKSEDGDGQVNIIGLIAVEGKQASARMEFLFDAATGNQRFGALKIDGKDQDNDVAAGLLSAMCAAAGGGPES